MGDAFTLSDQILRKYRFGEKEFSIIVLGQQIEYIVFC